MFIHWKNPALIFLFLSHMSIQAKVLLFTYAYNRPDFIEIQYKTFKKFLLDDYEFIVFNDAMNPSMQQEIQNICQTYSITCIDIPQQIHDIPYLDRPFNGTLARHHQPSVRNCNVVQYSLDTLGLHHNDIVALFDSDLFLVKKFSIRQFMEDHPIAAVIRQCNTQKLSHSCSKDHPGKPPYQFMWIGLAFLDMPKLQHRTAINFNCGFISQNTQLDSGGYTYYYLNEKNISAKAMPRVSLHKLICSKCKKKSNLQKSCAHNTETLQAIGLTHRTIQLAQQMPLYNKKQGRHIEFILNGTFIHYSAGTNHPKYSTEYQLKKSALVQDFFIDILKT